MSETRIPSARLDTTEFTFTELAVGAGTAALPSYSFSGDQNTGMYSFSGDNLGFSTNGTVRWVIDQNGTLFAAGASQGIQHPSGSAATPSINFTSDTNTGIYLSGDGEMSYVSNGSIVFRTEPGLVRSVVNFIPDATNTLSLGTTTNAWARVLTGDATVTSPAYSFAGATGTGMYRLGGGQLAFSMAGTRSFFIGTDGSINMDAGHNINADDGSVASPGYRFGNDPDTGIWRSGSDTMNFATGGVNRWQIDSGGALVSANSGASRIMLGDGSVSAPSISFGLDQNLGFYRIGTDEMGVAAGGGNLLFRFGFGGGLQTLFRGGTTAATPGLALGEASSVGFYRVAGLDVMGVSAPMGFSSGTAGNPSITFAGDENTGIYRTGADGFAFTQGGATSWALDNGSDYGFWRSQGTYGIQAGFGSAAKPSFGFVGDEDTGMYRSAANILKFAANGAEILQVSTGTIEVRNTAQFQPAAGTSALPGIGFNDDNDTGIYRAGTNIVGIAGNGAQIALFNPAQDANMLTLNQSYATGTVYALSANNTATGNAAADVRINIGVNDGSAGDPYMLWAIGGPTRYWTLGIDNSNSDVMVFSTTAGGTAKPGTGDVLIVAPNGLQHLDGTAAIPGLSFINDSDTGLFRTASNELAVSLGGTHEYNFTSIQFSPAGDNLNRLGSGSARWTEVHAVNGTIQTSHSSTKQNIVALDPSQVAVPEGVFYERDGRRWLGYLNDVLPAEGRPLDNELANYEQAVIGVLCAHVKKLEQDNTELKTLVQDLIKKLEA